MPTVGDMAWVQVDKKRIAVIVEVIGQDAYCLVGTSVDDAALDRVTVTIKEPLARILGLSNTTHFYANVVKATSVGNVVCRCPPRIYLKFDRMLERTAADYNAKRKGQKPALAPVPPAAHATDATDATEDA